MTSSFPTPIIATSRLILRPLAPPDTADLFAIFSDPLAVRYWSSAPWQRLSEAEQAIDQAIACYRDQSALRFGVQFEGRLIGTVNMHQFFPQNRRCELGYALHSAYWGRGLASEALTAALDHGFRELALNRVEADIDPRNDASARLLERLGFRREGFMPERWMVHGEVADTAFYGLLKRYWHERAGTPP